MIRIEAWDGGKALPTTPEIRSRYPDPSKYRVSENTYETGVSIPFITSEGFSVVLSGNCDVGTSQADSEKFSLSAGDVVHLSPGKYWLDVISTVTLVSVWDIEACAGKAASFRVTHAGFDTALAVSYVFKRRARDVAEGEGNQPDAMVS